MNKFSTTALKIAASTLNYITPALLFFFALSRVTARWHYTISHNIGDRTFNFMLFIAVSAFLLINRNRVLHFLKLDIVKFLMIVIVLGSAVYNNMSLVEFLVLAYALIAVLFFKTNNTSLISIIFNNESRTPALYALLCILLIPFLLIMKKESTAEQIAVYAYYFLVLTVVLRMLEMKFGVDRQNQVLDLLKDVSARSRQAVVRIRHISWASMRNYLFGPAMIKTGVFLVVLFLIVVLQTRHWKKIIRAVDGSPEYQAEISLLSPERGRIEFAPTVDEVTVPLKISHPLSNPRLWSNAGTNPVTVRALWFEQGLTGGPHDALSEQRIELPRPLLINESLTMMLKLKRPLLPGGRVYEVQLAVLHDGMRWFARTDKSQATVRVLLNTSRGLMPLTWELQSLQQSHVKLADAWSDQLLIHPEDYRSSIELVGKSNILTANKVKLAVTNNGKTPWPTTGKNPVQIGVAWIQKIMENGKVRHRHIDEQFYPLADVLRPGKIEITEISLDPFKHPVADEIWIGMNHKERQWFYERGDTVLKLMDKRAMGTEKLASIRRDSSDALDEWKRLEREKQALFQKIFDPSIPDNAKYRSTIALTDHPVHEPLQLLERREIDIVLQVTNNSTVTWPLGNEKPVRVGFAWFKRGSPAQLFAERIEEAGRCELPYVLRPGTTAEFRCKSPVKVPPGAYEVWIGLVHEGVTWFLEKGDNVLKLNVTAQ